METPTNRFHRKLFKGIASTLAGRPSLSSMAANIRSHSKLLLLLFNTTLLLILTARSFNGLRSNTGEQLEMFEASARSTVGASTDAVPGIRELAVGECAALADPRNLPTLRELQRAYVAIALWRSRRGERPAHMALHSSPSGVQYRGHSRLCTLSEAQVAGMLSLPHDTGRGGKRYFFWGHWMDWEGLSGQMWPKDGLLLPAHCIIAVTDDEKFGCSRTQPCIHAFHLRPNTSDILVLKQVYESKEMDYLNPIHDFSTILDAGAYAGMTASAFATTYPNALIISLEATKRNFQLLQMNTLPYANIVPLNLALWSKVAPLSVELSKRVPWAPEWGFQVVELGPDQTSRLKNSDSQQPSNILNGISIECLSQALKLPAFDFLKIDIEGAEARLFEDTKNKDLPWVDKAKLVALELHEDSAPGCEEAVHSYFGRKPYHHWKLGEMDVYLRK